MKHKTLSLGLLFAVLSTNVFSVDTTKTKKRGWAKTAISAAMTGKKLKSPTVDSSHIPTPMPYNQNIKKQEINILLPDFPALTTTTIKPAKKKITQPTATSTLSPKSTPLLQQPINHAAIAKKIGIGIAKAKEVESAIAKARSKEPRETKLADQNYTVFDGSDSESEIPISTKTTKRHPKNEYALTQIEFYDHHGYSTTMDITSGTILKMRTDYQTKPHTIVNFDTRTQREINIEESQTESKNKKDLKLPLYVALANQRCGEDTKSQSLATIMSIITKKTVEESDAKRCFEENRDTLLLQQPEFFKINLPEKPSTGNNEKLETYYKELTALRNRTRSIKNALMAQAHASGEQKDAMLQLAEQYNTQRVAVLDAMFAHEKEHNLPSTQSWGRTVTNMFSW
jgi:hypothetical protein